MSMITATAWVPRGFAAPFPQKYAFDEDEYERISRLARLHLDDDKDGADVGEKGDIEIDDELREYDLEHYDDNEETVAGHREPFGVIGNVKSLVYHENNDDDAYITMPSNVDDDVEREELQILDTDNLVLAGRIEDEMAHLEVYVYVDEDDNLYVHHDIMLSAIPLAVEWLDIPVGKGFIDGQAKGNFVAVGMMDPDIEIWDLDTVDSMYPDAVLGPGAGVAKDTQSTKKKGKRRSKRVNDHYHVDSVLSLAASRSHRNLLASSSADKTVKLWDLNATTCAKSYTHHTDKVCTLAWHPVETTVLLSGSYDRTAVAADMRAPEAKGSVWRVESDVEQVRWDPHDPNSLYISTENGAIHCHDARFACADPEQTRPVWMLQAHCEAVSSFDINPAIPGFIATASSDKEVKLWNVQPSGPSMVVSRNLDVGKVFSTTFAPDAEVAFRLAVAGNKGSVQVWDTSTNAAVRRAFSSRVAPVDGEIKERLVRVQDSDSPSDGGQGDSDAGPDEWESMDEA